MDKLITITIIITRDEVDLTDFIKVDLNRIANRLAIQDEAYRKRETDLGTITTTITIITTQK